MPARPLYLVVDVSFSTTDRFGAVTGIEQMNALTDALLDRLSTVGSGNGVWLSVIDFADEARLRVPLTPAHRLLDNGGPLLAARGGTSYARAFELATERIGVDVAQLRADGVEVAPPLMVFVTDGDPAEPDAEWQHAFAALVSLDREVAPHVWPVGYAHANPMLLDRLVSPPGWVAPHVLSPTDGVAEFPRKVMDVMALVEMPAPTTSGGARGPFVRPDPDDLDWHAIAPAPEAIRPPSPSASENS